MTTSSQLSLPLQQGHRNHYLFSDYYLNDILRRTADWREALKTAETMLPYLRQ